MVDCVLSRAIRGNSLRLADSLTEIQAPIDTQIRSLKGLTEPGLRRQEGLHVSSSVKATLALNLN